MKSTLRKIVQRFEAALVSAFGEPGAAADPMVRPVQDARFGDYQSNCAMALAKRVKAKPREVADRIVAALEIDDLCDPPEIAGPGFINLRLKPEYVADQLRAIPPGGPNDRLGLAPSSERQTVAVDFSSPNLVKAMHVGHLRSTVIGECVSRILEFDGHTVHRINHVGDWGTQFGMLVAFINSADPVELASGFRASRAVIASVKKGTARADILKYGIHDLEALYVAAKSKFDRDEAFADEARQSVVNLQRGDSDTRKIWEAFCEESLRHCQEIYDRLSVHLETVGESFYNDMLPGVVADLEERGLITISDGAACVFLEGFEDQSRDGAPLPIIVRKSDGAYNYSTTDLAAIRHRRFTLGVTRFIYVVGAPQRQHFQMLFAAARRAGWVDDGVELTHLAFGSMLGSDGRPFKTREGGTIKLKNLLDEAVARARQVIEANEADEHKRRGLSADQKDAIAEAVGITAVRYFDLSHNLTSDYTFDWDRILAMDGNTGPYMLYAYARIRSIGREAGIDYADLPPDAPIILEHPAEIGLAKTLLRLPEIIETISRELRPNVLTDYLFELSRAYNLFYDRKHGVRVKDAKPEAVRTSRLRLCDLTARALRLGLGLLGISTIERM